MGKLVWVLKRYDNLVGFLYYEIFSDTWYLNNKDRKEDIAFIDKKSELD